MGVTGGTPLGFNVGAPSDYATLPGLDLGVRGMRVGGQRKLLVPPNLVRQCEGAYESGGLARLKCLPPSVAVAPGFRLDFGRDLYHTVNRHQLVPPHEQYCRRSSIMMPQLGQGKSSVLVFFPDFDFVGHPASAISLLDVPHWKTQLCNMQALMPNVLALVHCRPARVAMWWLVL